MAFKNIEAEIDGGGVLRLVEIPQISDGENISVGLRVSADEDFLDGQPSDAIYCFEFMAADGGRYVTPPTSRLKDSIDGSRTRRFCNNP